MAPRIRPPRGKAAATPTPNATANGVTGEGGATADPNGNATPKGVTTKAEPWSYCRPPRQCNLKGGYHKGGRVEPLPAPPTMQPQRALTQRWKGGVTAGPTRNATSKGVITKVEGWSHCRPHPQCNRKEGYHPGGTVAPAPLQPQKAQGEATAERWNGGATAGPTGNATPQGDGRGGVLPAPYAQQTVKVRVHVAEANNVRGCQTLRIRLAGADRERFRSNASAFKM